MHELRINVYGAEPYVIHHEDDLADAIELESRTVAEDADSRHIDDPSEETREAFRLNVAASATFHLNHSGEYVDPLGVRWSLVTVADDDGEV